MPRGKKPHFTPEQDIEIARRYQAGETLRQLADSYGVSDVPVRAALDRQQVERRTVTDYTWQDTPDARAEIIRLWHEDASVKKISRLVRTRDVNVSMVLREAGIEARLGGQHHRFSEEQTVVLVEEFQAGVSLAKLAKKHGGNPITVRGALRRAGVDTDRKHPLSGPQSALAPVDKAPLFDAVMRGYDGRQVDEWVHKALASIEQLADISNLQLRNGHHGSGVVFQCRSCGSHDVVAVPIAGQASEGTEEVM